MNNIIGLKELRQNFEKYIREVRKGKSFLVMKRSQPSFRLVPPEEEWETVIDFREINKDGVPIEDVILALQKIDGEDKKVSQKIAKK